ncbi:MULTISPECIES: DUF3515 domain-containing protein [unclassified Mycolicibacterium]|uniref:DUF3515 domain-containing protein n=1 Tax=unclassified Mycolicibacterium TaxID=2636767 RepID=UPI001305F77B|nr:MULTISPECIES: DUF3515 domain-containing protein [unclassified Mycolicibacterium]MUL80582.1 DUF3515 domain-containing protein [Mycolicibacterium sp. CBMA 329]MUL86349.1 DUF3515 domain-containing protein [Mycolicibacterium sp. CBMA 331]MUM01211.1 DUF3515 domain-containing protein [Mycolicibacterium sp. CBMA 334]MUM26859.1 DUF3515 domain-containing protein [Mycolicibacterium sp. CBMA 295]MUM36645.1 DUF3515 domain-containing protein [Mycolicibacterium sp. CBMA 247]
MTDSHAADGPPRALLIAAVVVAVSVLITVLGIAASRQRSPEQQPVAIPAIPAPQADSDQCHDLLNALPQQLGDFRRAATVDPTPPGTAAWRAEPDTEPVILRCGLERPSDFVVGTPLQVVDEVQWFRVGEASAASQGGYAEDQGRSTWYAVDRPVYVALTLPAGSGPTPIQQISGQITRAMPAQEPAPAPAG